MKSVKMMLIVAAGVVSVGIAGLFVVQGSRNKAISLEHFYCLL